MKTSHLAALLAAGVASLGVGSVAVAHASTPIGTSPALAVTKPPQTGMGSAAQTEAAEAVARAAAHAGPLAVSAVPSRRLGDIISTGLDASKVSEWVIYGVPLKSSAAPKSTFGFTIGERRNNGSVKDYLTINEYKGSDLAPGFHPTQSSMTLDNGMVQPAFGYYVGDPTAIKARFGGKATTAHTATWSYNHEVTVFWFTAVGVITDLSAYDASGKKLPPGHVDIWTN